MLFFTFLCYPIKAKLSTENHLKHLVQNSSKSITVLCLQIDVRSKIGRAKSGQVSRNKIKLLTKVEKNCENSINTLSNSLKNPPEGTRTIAGHIQEEILKV